MELRRNSWHAWYYRNFYLRLPDSLCTYFWGLVLALLLAPLVILGIIYALYTSWRNNKESYSVVEIPIWLFIFFPLIGYVVGHGIFVKTHYRFDYFLQLLVGTGVVIVFLTVFCLILIGFVYVVIVIQEKIAERQGNGDHESKWIVVEWMKGFVKKYCPRINWI